MNYVSSGDISVSASFQVKHEARDVGLRPYKQPFIELFSGCLGYFNFEADTLNLLFWEAAKRFYKFSDDISAAERSQENFTDGDRLRWLDEREASPWDTSSSISSSTKRRRRAIMVA